MVRVAVSGRFGGEGGRQGKLEVSKLFRVLVAKSDTPPYILGKVQQLVILWRH